jgi:DDE superfamily endonuclease
VRKRTERQRALPLSYQALQHKYPAKPVRAGQVARIEHEYDRQGTLCLIANLEVATGRMVAPSVGPRRTEADFLTHIHQTVALAPQDPWLFIVDNLNTHQSASFPMFVPATSRFRRRIAGRPRPWSTDTRSTAAGRFCRNTRE